MIGQRLLDAINEQINAELFSSYLYMSMGSYFESIGMAGAANWMRVQTLEEMTHADKLYNYVNERGGRAVFKAIDEPQNDWATPLAAFEGVLEHEQLVTSLINKLMNVAIEEKDHAGQIFLQWFISEQVEEENNAQTIIDQIKLAGGNSGALFMIDRELGARVFTPPTTGA